MWRWEPCNHACPSCDPLPPTSRPSPLPHAAGTLPGVLRSQPWLPPCPSEPPRCHSQAPPSSQQPGWTQHSMTQHGTAQHLSAWSAQENHHIKLCLWPACADHPGQTPHATPLSFARKAPTPTETSPHLAHQVLDPFAWVPSPRHVAAHHAEPHQLGPRPHPHELACTQHYMQTHTQAHHKPTQKLPHKPTHNPAHDPANSPTHRPAPQTHTHTPGSPGA